MSELPDNPVTAALTFKVPQKVGWSVQSNDQSWTGSTLSELADCLIREGNQGTMTLSISLVFELAGNEGTLRSMTEATPWKYEK